LALLDRETRALHAEADWGWHRLLRDDGMTREEYVHQLTVAYGFECPFEVECSYTPGLGQMIDLRGRSRSMLIAQDLLALGRAVDEVKAVPCHAFAPFQDAAEALAWIYAVERPTLIHDEVCDRLTSRFRDLWRATSYLNAFESDASKRRAELGIALDRLCVSDTICMRVIEAARAGFHAMIEWQRANSPALQRVG
jgi:heme oxygenase